MDPPPCSKCGMTYDQARDWAQERGLAYSMGSDAGRWLCIRCLREELGAEDESLFQPESTPIGLFD